MIVILQTLPCCDSEKAPGILKQLQKPSTVYTLVMMKRLLATTDILHKYLQTENLDMSKALQYKDAVLQTLTDMRCSDTADEIYAEALELMKENDITLPNPESKRTVKKRRMDDFICISTEMMRTRLYYPVIDRMITEMRARFSPQNEGVLLGINSCNPSSDSFMEPKNLKKLSNHYNLELFEPEVPVAKNLINALQLKAEKKFTMERVYALIDEQAFPTLKKVFQVALTIPVTSCSCERSFSCMRRVKTWLRTKMTQDRLDSLSVLAIERDCYTSCTEEELVASFNSMKRRRKQLHV